jgi:putative ABC transport system permease protein
VQVALSLVLLTAAGLVVRSFDRLLQADPGFRADGVLTARVPIPPQFVAEPEAVLSVQNRIHDALESIPGVSAASAATALPLSAGSNQTTIRIPGAPGNTGHAEKDALLVDVLGVRAGYIEAMGIRVVAGRAFERARRPDVREAMIDRHVAERFFPNRSPIGATIPSGSNVPVTIVGVIDQARLYDVHEDGRPQVFTRAEDSGYRNLSFVVRTTRDPTSLVPDVRAAIRRINPQLAVADVRTMDEIVADSLRQQRTSAVLIAGFAIGALLLAAMGLVGIVSGAVTRRRHELAVRLALGADHGAILRLVLVDAALIVGLGVLIGAPGIYAMSGLLRGVLVGVSPSDPLTIVSVASGLAIVALAACYLPARRVLGIEPAQSLRQ